MLAALLAWLRWELPPLERYYLLAYWESSTSAERPDNTTQIEWLYKTAPERKSEPVTSQDVDSNGSGFLPIELSSSARERGWIDLIQSAAQRWNSSELANVLQENFYDSRTFTEVIAEPVCLICVILLIVLCGVIVMRQELVAEWRRLYEEICDARSAFDSHDLWARMNDRIRRSLSPQFASAWATLSRSESFLRDSPNCLSNAPTVHSGIGDVLTGGQADQSTCPSMAPQPHLIFPRAAASRAGSPLPKPWDESEWIE